MILKQNFKNHTNSLWFTIVTTLLIVMGWWYFNFDQDYLYVLGLFHVVFTIPALYLHIQYAVRNAFEEIEINPNEIIVKKKGQERRYNSRDLSKIIVYKSASLNKGGMPLSAMECYHYARLELNTGEEIIITCLMTRKVDEEVRKLSGVPCERKKRFFCAINWK